MMDLNDKYLDYLANILISKKLTASKAENPQAEVIGFDDETLSFTEWLDELGEEMKQTTLDNLKYWGDINL